MNEAWSNLLLTIGQIQKKRSNTKKKKLVAVLEVGRMMFWHSMSQTLPIDMADHDTTETNNTEKNAGASKKGRGKRAASTAEPKPKQIRKRGVSAKRGPPRPHRKLAEPVLQVRIAKLQKRIDRNKAQYEDAERHIAAYLVENALRSAAALNPPPAVVDAESEESDTEAKA